jgi:hypothetical protein
MAAAMQQLRAVHGRRKDPHGLVIGPGRQAPLARRPLNNDA